MAHSFTTAEIIDRLGVLCYKLEEEGRYVSANTAYLAMVRLAQLTPLPDIEPDIPKPPISVTVREVPELSSGLGDGIRQTKADIKPAFQCAARAQGTAGGNDPADCDWPYCGCGQ